MHSGRAKEQKSFPSMFHIFLVFILACELAHGKLIQLVGHTGNKLCTTLAHVHQETTVYFNISFVGAKDTTINITLSRDIDIPCMNNNHSVRIYMDESSASEDLSCSGSYQVTYSSKGLEMKLEDPSKNKSVPFFCIDWWINAVEKPTMIGMLEGRFNTTGFDVSYSGDNGESWSSTMDTEPSYQAEIKVPLSSNVKVSPVSFKNLIPDDCEVLLNSTSGNTGFVPNDVESIRIVSNYKNAENLEIMINNKTINKTSCIRFVNIPKNISNVGENVSPISMFSLYVLLFLGVVCLSWFVVACCNINCTYITRHGRYLSPPVYV